MFDINYWITKLQLQPHPEGGYYKETYRCGDMVEFATGKRNISTAIYFLIDGNNKSHLHRIKSDELWFFHEGDPLEVICVNQNGLEIISLGKNPEKGESFQAVVPADTWFGARVKNGKGFSLVSCTVAPGFDFRDFEMANKEEMLTKFPEHKELMKEMCL